MWNRFFLALELVVLLTVLVLVPQLKLPWMLIDDAENLRMGQEISRHFSSGDYTWILSYEKVNGRFRPAYWLWHFTNFKVFGFNSFGHHFGHLLLYTLISVLIFLIAQKISKSNLAGFLAVVFFLFFYPTAENFYRLGTAEPPLLVFYLLIALFLVRAYFDWFANKDVKPRKRDLLIIFVFLGFAYFMKESAPALMVAFLPLFLIGLLDLKVKNKKSWLLFSGFFVLSNLFFFILTFSLKRYFGISGGYTEAYKADLVETISRFFVYLRMILREYKWVLVVPVVSFSLFIFSEFQKSKRKFRVFLASLSSLTLWEVVFVSWFFIFLAIQSPWIYVMGRYLPPVTCWLAIFLAVEYAKVFSCQERLSWQISHRGFSFNAPVLKIFSLFFIFWLVVGHGKRINLMYQSALRNERFTQNLVRFLAKETPPSGTIYANFSEGIMEYLYELPLHFRFFYQRPDIKVDYLFLDKPHTFRKGDFIIAFKEQVWRYPWKDVKESFDKTKEISLYEFGPYWSILVFKEEEIFDNIQGS